ncbi:hypothetical protein B9Z19DRAFT_7043 [Tuber borchii]|uniref:Uncharacterized protein n=1 Tax=Tuber borchii TaxID=42251 RepID=A0A2T7A9I3_TUBBO|nr:hypothetical protein B9Z19DRAFT_7043 [Tuber borchii]
MPIALQCNTNSSSTKKCPASFSIPSAVSGPLPPTIFSKPPRYYSNDQGPPQNKVPKQAPRSSFRPSDPPHTVGRQSWSWHGSGRN